MRKTFLCLLAVIMSIVAIQPAARAGQNNGGTSQASGTATDGQDQKGPAETGTYVIGPEDVLDISVWKEPNVSRTVPVRPDGKISLPLLNDVQASGLTPMQLQEALTERFKKFINEPQVTVIVTQINSQRVYVLGEVPRPGSFQIFPDMNVLQALAEAGGFSQFAKLSGIYVLRTENGQQKTLPFDYKAVVRGQRADENILLKPGDTIVVP